MDFDDMKQGGDRDLLKARMKLQQRDRDFEEEEEAAGGLTGLVDRYEGLSLVGGAEGGGFKLPGPKLGEAGRREAVRQGRGGSSGLRGGVLLVASLPQRIDFPKLKSMIVGFVHHGNHGVVVVCVCDQGNMVVGVVEEIMVEGGKGRKGGWLEEGGRFDEWYAIADGGGGSRTEWAMKDGDGIRMELVMWRGVWDVGRRVGPASMRMVGGGDEGSGGPPGPSD